MLRREKSSVSGWEGQRRRCFSLPHLTSFFLFFFSGGSTQQGGGGVGLCVACVHTDSVVAEQHPLHETWGCLLPVLEQRRGWRNQSDCCWLVETFVLGVEACGSTAHCCPALSFVPYTPAIDSFVHQYYLVFCITSKTPFAHVCTTTHKYSCYWYYLLSVCFAA